MSLRNKPGVPQKGWRQVGDAIDRHKDGGSPDCDWCCEKIDRRWIYILEHDDYKSQIRVGSNCKEEATEEDINSRSHENESNNKDKNELENSISDVKQPLEEKPLPVPELVLLAGVSIALLGNFTLFEDFYSQLIPDQPPPPTQRQIPSESPRNPNNRNRNELPPEVAKKLRDCLQENIKSLVGVPGLSDLIDSLISENESSITETQKQIRFLYNKVQQLRKTIEDCDPSLIKELIEADQRDDQENKQEQENEREQEQFECRDSVIVIGGLVNVRVRPTSDSEVIAQALYGTCLQIDTQAFIYLSEDRRQAIVPCECWYPVILPDGMRGYIYSRYASRVYFLP